MIFIKNINLHNNKEKILQNYSFVLQDLDYNCDASDSF